MSGAPIRVTRRFDATPGRVFEAWLDPTTASRFLFATPNGRMVRAEIDSRPGGAFVFVDRRDGDDVAHVGEYIELRRPAPAPSPDAGTGPPSSGTATGGRIRFRFSVPKYSPLSTEVAVELAADGPGTQLTLVHEGVPAEWAASTEQGWNGILEALATVLAAAR